ADADELLDRAEGARQQRCRRVADVPDAEREDEAVELRLAPRVDRREQLVEALEVAILDAAHVLARLAGGQLPLPRLLLPPFGHHALDVRPAILEREYVCRRLDQACLEEQFDVLGAKPFDVHCPARDEVLEALYGLCRADQLAGATPPRILLAGLFVQLSRRRRATDRACVRKLVRHGI